MKKITATSLLASMLLATPAFAAIIYTESFDQASSIDAWTIAGGSASTSSKNWLPAEGNPAGALGLTAAHVEGANPLSGTATSFLYTVNGLNFGSNQVEVSFDGKLLSGLPGTAIHTRINGNFFGAIMVGFNDVSYTNFKQVFDVANGFTGDTFSLEFEFAMGPVANAGGQFAVDNIQVNVVPEPATLGLFAGVCGLGFLLWHRRRAGCA